MSKWTDYVPAGRLNEFRTAFIQIVLSENIECMLEQAHFYATRHNTNNCPDIGGCEECLDDSDDRDTKEFAEHFFSSLWKRTCEKIELEEPSSAKKQKQEEE